ncbi:MAG: hypothetical protein K1X53_01555 [Candidatus Sumerlaeaceae bacterium]|nr:hypothetical protein [Candidatus Sumerlaeaceae bacterium]
MPEAQIVGESEPETIERRRMAVEARDYLCSFHWCKGVRSIHMGLGIGGVVGVFLAELTEPAGTTDKYLWVVVGDMPSAYLVTEQAATPVDALRIYCDLMDDWANAVKKGTGIESVFPVAADPTVENAENLLKRVSFLRRVVIPRFTIGGLGGK